MSLFKKQGGTTFAGSILEIIFEVTNWNNDAAAKKAGRKPYSTFSAKVTIDKDGAQEPVTNFLEAGFIYPDRGQGVSEDGKTLTGGAAVGENTEFARLVQSAVDAGFDVAALLDADGNGTNFSALEGGRYEFGRAINREKQMASGRKALGIKSSDSLIGKLGKEYTEQEVMSAGRRQDKNDKTKFYNQTYMVVESILGDVAAAPAPAASKAAAAPVTVAAKGKPNGKAVEVEPDYETADGLLVDALASAKNNTLKTTSLSSIVVKWAVENDKSNEERDAIRSMFSDAAYLGRQAGWKMGADGKSVSL
jgi:hypothetical protein